MVKENPPSAVGKPLVLPKHPCREKRLALPMPMMPFDQKLTPLLNVNR